MSNPKRNFTDMLEKVGMDALKELLPEDENIEDYSIHVELRKSMTEEEALLKGYIDENGKIIKGA